jgi:hypothetical protein
VGFVCAIADEVIMTNDFSRGHLANDDYCTLSFSQDLSAATCSAIRSRGPQSAVLDIIIPHDENLVKAEKDQASLYLAHEITAMWDVDSVIIVPIAVSANGLIAKSLDQHHKRR